MLRLLPYLLLIVGFTLVYAAVPNCRVPLRHAFVGGVIAATSFNIARALFTKLVAGSSITFIYGAFAAVPLFLLWIYISWNIVLVSAIVVHSLSAYQSEAQARRPLLIKGLEILETLWQRQSKGLSLRELDLLNGRQLTVDAESWQKLRDCFLQNHVITQDERGHYLLARDLHNIPLWQLQQWLDSEGDVNIACKDTMPRWEQQAITLLKEQQQGIKNHMNMPLTTLFEKGNNG
jgi:membrane protein